MEFKIRDLSGLVTRSLFHNMYNSKYSTAPIKQAVSLPRRLTLPIVLCIQTASAAASLSTPLSSTEPLPIPSPTSTRRYSKRSGSFQGFLPLPHFSTFPRTFFVLLLHLVYPSILLLIVLAFLYPYNYIRRFGYLHPDFVSVFKLPRMLH